MKLGERYSNIKSLNDKDWKYANFLYLKNGGNANFKSFMLTYNLDHEPAFMKYRSKAAEYYRRRV